MLGNGAKLTEVDVADKCEHFRRFFQTKVKPLISREQADFVGLSFDTISSVGANAAIIHYKPERPKCAVLDRNQIYLCDSGGQFRWLLSFLLIALLHSFYCIFNILLSQLESDFHSFIGALIILSMFLPTLNPQLVFDNRAFFHLQIVNIVAFI